jgi:hypothetical protein
MIDDGGDPAHRDPVLETKEEFSFRVHIKRMLQGQKLCHFLPQRGNPVGIVAVDLPGKFNEIFVMTPSFSVNDSKV